MSSQSLKINGGSIHRFVRNSNYVSSNDNRVANRAKPFQNTLTILEDKKQNKKLFLIGTTNSSTLLSYRTQELILQEKPDSVYVQTNKKWVDKVSNIQGITTQSQFNQYNSILRSTAYIKQDYNFRGLVFQARLVSWLFVANLIKCFPSDFHPFIPGLEMKLAVEAAQKLNCNLILGGQELNEETLQSLSYEKRFDVIPLLYRLATSLNNDFWKHEQIDAYKQLNTNGGEAFGENLDKFRLNWFIKLFQKLSPHQKVVMIDKKDKDMFYQLYRDTPGNKIVAVVNQWHVPGIESHWLHSTGQQLENTKEINPVGDMDLNAYQESQLVNNKLRILTSRLTKSEPSSWQNYITQYHKDGMEPERTRHVSFLNSKDDNMHHGLPSDTHDKDELKPEFEVPEIKYPDQHH